MSKLVDVAKQYFPSLGGGKNKPSHKQVMSLRPARHPGVVWTRSPETGLVVVTLTQHRFRYWDKLIGKIFQIPTQRKVEMSDELSSKVWEMCDGTHTVGAIATTIANEYKITQRQSEVSVLTFLNTLQNKKLVGIPQDQADKLKQPPAEPKRRPKGSKGFYATRKERE